MTFPLCFNVSEQLAKSTSPYAQAKAEEFYQKGVDATQLEQTNKLQRDRIDASAIKTELIVDSEGRQFEKVINELTQKVTYAAVDGKEGSPEGAIKTQTDVSIDKRATAQRRRELLLFVENNSPIVGIPGKTICIYIDPVRLFFAATGNIFEH